MSATDIERRPQRAASPSADAGIRRVAATGDRIATLERELPAIRARLDQLPAQESSALLRPVASGGGELAPQWQVVRYSPGELCLGLGGDEVVGEVEGAGVGEWHGQLGAALAEPGDLIVEVVVVRGRVRVVEDGARDMIQRGRRL
jgi:hypothetical protein